jgi:hypothetical protein
VIDTERFDDSNTFNGAFIQDITQAYVVPNISGIGRVNTWDQGTNTFTLYGPFRLNAPGALANDVYEVHQKVTFEQLGNSVNNGIAICGKWLRNLVRDESQVLVSNQYEVIPNYSAALPNAFFPGEVVRIDFQPDPGQPTSEWSELTGWYYLDDETIQLPTWVVDSFASNSLRFTGYGPVTGYILDANPNTVIGTFDDDFAATMLIWAVTADVWGTLASQLQANEQSAAAANEQRATQKWQAIRETWARGRSQTGRVKTPQTAGGWSGT